MSKLMKHTKISALVLGLSLTVASTMAMAADGTPGLTSTGTFNTRLEVKDNPQTTVAISDLQDFDLGILTKSQLVLADPVPDPSTFKPFCVLLSNPGNLTQPKISFSQSNNPVGFSLTRITTNPAFEQDQLGIELYFYDAVTNAGTSGVVTGTQYLISANQSSCSGGPNPAVYADLAVKPRLGIRRFGAGPVVANLLRTGTYTSVITVTVTAN
jgi:hypothetical protein